MLLPWPLQCLNFVGSVALFSGVGLVEATISSKLMTLLWLSSSSLSDDDDDDDAAAETDDDDAAAEADDDDDDCIL